MLNRIIKQVQPNLALTVLDIGAVPIANHYGSNTASVYSGYIENSASKTPLH